MSTSSITRRAAVANLGALAALCAGSVPPALAQAGVRFRDIRVDVSPLRASAGDPTADWVEQALPGYLAKSMAPYLSPGGRDGASLVARVDTVYLGRTTGGTGPGGGSIDVIEGALIVKGPRGAAATPLRAITSYHPSAVDQALFEDGYHGRVAALAEAFAGWAPRELGI
jgi:hypothetical protein